MAMAILKVLIVVAGYGITIGLSGIIVRYFVGGHNSKRDQGGESDLDRQSRYDIGALIGKCENLLTITFILADALTGLALIFTAKSIVRSDDIKKDPRYFLGGTLVNFSFSVLMGFLVKLALGGVG